MIGTILRATEIKDLRAQSNRELSALYNVSMMGRRCLRVGDTRRSDEIFEVVVDETPASRLYHSNGSAYGYDLYEGDETQIGRAHV